ncbi:MAG: MFS transporter [Eubacteriales bacterium]|nr:MFS transporter [Eubacteriales bacterium]
MSVPSKERSKYFAVRDVFLYGGIAISTFLSSFIIQKVGIDFLYGILSGGFLITMICALQIGKTGNIKQEIQEKIFLKDYLNELKKIIKNKFFGVLLLFEISSVVYAIILKFIPLLALQKKVELYSFLNYTAVFTIINCIGSFILTYIARGARRKKFI